MWPLLFILSTAVLMAHIRLLMLSALQSAAAMCALLYVVIIQWRAAQLDDQQRAWRPFANLSGDVLAMITLTQSTTDMLGPVSAQALVLRCHTSDTPSTSALLTTTLY
jgi:hypothetical protein